MRLRLSFSVVAAAVVALGLSTAPSCATTIFDAVWSGAPFGNSATATGQITIDETLLPNPGDYSDGFTLPGWLTGVTITITGASSGNGTFTLADFSGAFWDTDGGTLDLGTQLIGQPTSFLPWGTEYSGFAGDFNLFMNGSAQGIADDAPQGTFYFQLTSAHGSGDPMRLTYFGIPGTPWPQIPEPATAIFVLTGLFGLGAASRRRRKA